MKILTNTYNKGRLSFESVNVFPDNPTLGELCFKENQFYAYSEIAGVIGWVPLISDDTTSYIVYKQTTPSNIWRIEHNLDTEDIIFQVYDESNKLILANINVIDNNTCEIIFATDEKGKCIIISVTSDMVEGASNIFISKKSASEVSAPNIIPIANDKGELNSWIGLASEDDITNKTSNAIVDAAVLGTVLENFKGGSAVPSDTNIPSIFNKTGQLLSTDGQKLLWHKANQLIMDNSIYEKAFTANINTIYNISWKTTNYTILLPDNPSDGDKIQFQNLDHSLYDKRIIYIKCFIDHVINDSLDSFTLNEKGIDVIFTFNNIKKSWFASASNTTNQPINNLIPATIYWNVNTKVDTAAYVLGNPNLPHNDKNLYSVSIGSAGNVRELLPAEFNITQSTNTLTLINIPIVIEPIRVTCVLRYPKAEINSNTIYPKGFINYFESSYTPDLTYWKTNLSADKLSIIYSSNYPNTTAFRMCAITVLNDGRIFVAGGSIEGTYTDICYFGTFDKHYKTIEWQVCSTQLPLPSAYCHMETLDNDKIIYVCGYPNSNKCYLGTVFGNSVSWAATQDLPRSASLHQASFVKLDDGRCLFMCGWDGSTVYNNCYILNATGSSWVASTAYPLNVYGASITKLPDGKILVAAGHNGATCIKSCYIGTITNNTISWKNVSDLPYAWYFHQLGCIDDKLILIGGYNLIEGWITTGVLGIYNPISVNITWELTNNKLIQDLSCNTRLHNVTPTQLISVGGSYTNDDGAYNSSNIFEIQNAYVRI